MFLFKIDNKYMLLGGVIGALITYTVIKSIGALGPGQGILIIVTSQLLVAYLIEVFGAFGVEKVGFQWQKLVGIITNRDMRFLTDLNVPIKDYMTKDNLITLKEGATLEEAKALAESMPEEEVVEETATADAE